MTKQTKDGWIRHRGGKCPVEAGVPVSVRYRNGEIETMTMDDIVGYRVWEHKDSQFDIMAYRVCEPAIEPAVAAILDAINKHPEKFAALKFADVCDPVVDRAQVDPAALAEIASINVAHYSENPRQWRDRITQIDATAQALTTERADLVAKLAAEGFALIAVVVEPAEWVRWAEIGQRIRAIKAHRDLYGSSLRDAKDAVDLYQSSTN